MVSKVELVLFKEIELYCLQLLIMTHEDYLYLKEKKSMMMHKMDRDWETIKLDRIDFGFIQPLCYTLKIFH